MTDYIRMRKSSGSKR